MEKKTRLRAPNFTRDDTLLLCEIVSKYIHIIENKKTDGAHLQQKQKAWLEVVKEFNSTTSGFSRSVEGLQQMYKNLKKKAKKNASDEKMEIPVDPATFVLNIEECGTSSQSCDSPGKVAATTDASEETCKEMLANIVDRILKRTMDTGGGPPSKDDKDPVLEKVKELLGPVLDGVYTICDGDSSLTASQNKPPIELQNIRSGMQETQDHVDNEETRNNGDNDNQDFETYFSNNRASLKKKLHHSFACKRKSDTETKQTVSDKFKLLATEKIELFELQKELVKSQLQEEHDRAEHHRMMRAMELEDAKKKYIHNEKLREMEMEEMRRRNEFNEKLRGFENKIN